MYCLSLDALRRGFLFDMNYKLVGQNKKGQQLIEYICPSCGGAFTTLHYGYKKSKTKMCRSCSKKTHGLNKHPLYAVWTCMKQRCYNPRNPKYDGYGGRGITVCSEWLDSFQVFYNWAIANGYKKGLTIDRINNDGNYCPQNCRWATPLEQVHNTRTPSNNTVGYVGVYKSKHRPKWFWYLNHIGKRYKKYGFPTPEEAVAARNQFIKENGLPHKLQ